MNEQLRFLQMVEELACMGKEKNGQLTRAEVETYLREHESNVANMEAICEFLFAKQVLVEGYVPKKEASSGKKRSLYPEEEAFRQSYEEELKAYTKPEPAQLAMLCSGAVNNPASAEELTTAILPMVYELAKEYAGGKALLGDLVQEANLAAIMTIGTLGETDKLAQADGEEILKYIQQKIRLAIEALIAEEQDTNLEARKIADKLNQLVEAVEALKEQQAEYTLEDLSEFLAIDIEEIENLLRIAGELEED